MWVFTKEGFFSVVQKDCEADEVLVRSRQKRDLIGLAEKIGVKVKLLEGVGTDYRYRAVVKKKDWAKYLSDSALDLDYDNFKNTVSNRDHRRHSAYLRVWEALLAWQESTRK